ncbi:hypothetical protein P4O66_000494 [Electrophorus voltai]|uniref:Uncharacterized protein n=1 Tax=Electrophorus voltai TaxID=2609070 RepID=A0AAD8ZGK9_9TELE|nr:hypothetical protein P4O66_000494 [Electrophorus voltai]
MAWGTARTIAQLKKDHGSNRMPGYSLSTPAPTERAVDVLGTSLTTEVSPALLMFLRELWTPTELVCLSVRLWEVPTSMSYNTKLDHREKFRSREHTEYDEKQGNKHDALFPSRGVAPERAQVLYPVFLLDFQAKGEPVLVVGGLCAETNAALPSREARDRVPDGEPLRTPGFTRLGIPMMEWPSSGWNLRACHNEKTTVFRHPVTGQISPENTDFVVHEPQQPTIAHIPIPVVTLGRVRCVPRSTVVVHVRCVTEWLRDRPGTGATVSTVGDRPGTGATVSTVGDRPGTGATVSTVGDRPGTGATVSTVGDRPGTGATVSTVGDRPGTGATVSTVGDRPGTGVERANSRMSRLPPEQRTPSMVSESSTAVASSTVDATSGSKSSKPSGKIHSFGKRDHAIQRNPNMAVVVRGWLYKQVSSALKRGCGGAGLALQTEADGVKSSPHTTTSSSPICMGIAYDDDDDDDEEW